MTGWLTEWAQAATSIKQRLENSPENCRRCGTRKALGYSTLGIPVECCPTCSPDLAGRGSQACGDVFGVTS